MCLLQGQQLCVCYDKFQLRARALGRALHIALAARVVIVVHAVLDKLPHRHLQHLGAARQLVAHLLGCAAAATDYPVDIAVRVYALVVALAVGLAGAEPLFPPQHGLDFPHGLVLLVGCKDVVGLHHIGLAAVEGVGGDGLVELVDSVVVEHLWCGWGMGYWVGICYCGDLVYI